MPQHVRLFLREVIVRLKDRKLIFWCSAAEFIFPFSHLLAMPALHAAIVDTKGGVWNDQFLVYTHNHAEALTLRTCSER